jgi:hypothetical protein
MYPNVVDKNATEGRTDANELRFVAIEEGLCPAD